MFNHLKFICNIGQVTAERTRPSASSGARMLEKMQDKMADMMDLQATAAFSSIWQQQIGNMAQPGGMTPAMMSQMIQQQQQARNSSQEVPAWLSASASASSAPLPSLPPRPIPPVRITPVAPSKVYPSSPLSSSQGLDYNIVDNFFGWVIGRLSDEESVKQEWKHARDIAKERFWVINDLKAMDKYDSEQSREAEGALIPRGIARSFRDQLRRYRRWQEEDAHLMEELTHNLDYSSGRA